MIDWFNLNYEQKLFLRKINDLFANGFSNEEIMELTGLEEYEVFHCLNQFNKIYNIKYLNKDGGVNHRYYH